jgi:hypothetical protein
MRVGTKGSIGTAMLGGLAALAVAAPVAGASPSASVAAGTACPAAFRVLHNDQIGPAFLPKGNYTITIRNSSVVNCASASALFSRFLQDYDGKLQKPWTVVARGKGKALFNSGGSPGFSVAQTKGTGPGPAPGPSPLGKACRGAFQVQNDDQIGLVQFPKGGYKLIITRGSIITCAKASKLFASFLSFPSGALPKGWAIKPTTALFYKPGNPNPKRKRFRVDPAT